MYKGGIQRIKLYDEDLYNLCASPILLGSVIKENDDMASNMHRRD
jgi:hypothetical protein